MFSFHHFLHRGSKLCQEKGRRAGDRCVSPAQQDSLEDVYQTPKHSVLKGWPALIRRRKGNNFSICLAKMTRIYTVSWMTKIQTNVSVHLKKQKSLWRLRNYYLLLSQKIFSMENIGCIQVLSILASLLKCKSGLYAQRFQ